jgi:hypothetical protein
MEYPGLLAFWSAVGDQQLGRVIDMAHIGRDLGNNRIIQTSIRNYPEPLTSNYLLHKGIEPF